MPRPIIGRTLGHVGAGAVLGVLLISAASAQNGRFHARSNVGARRFINAPARFAPNFNSAFRARRSVYYNSGPTVFYSNGASCYVPLYYPGPDYGGLTITYDGQFGPYYIHSQNGDLTTYYDGQVGSYHIHNEQSSGYRSSGSYYSAAPAYSSDPPVEVAPQGGGYRVSEGDSQRSAGSDHTTPSAQGSGGQGDDNGYYLTRKPRATSPPDRDPALAQAISDIENAFRQGDISLLEKHLVMNENLSLLTDGRTRRPLSATQYLAMTRDALKTLNTVRYNLDHVEPGSNGAWLVYGMHVVRDARDMDTAFDVGFVLKKQDERWVITEVSSDPEK